jgi:hypothetical protein
LGHSIPNVLTAEWGWGTDDSVAALGFVKRFGSVTVLNGATVQSGIYGRKERSA